VEIPHTFVNCFAIEIEAMQAGCHTKATQALPSTQARIQLRRVAAPSAI
jgi:hypothetical protein